jgi:hypothetical protein
VVTFFAAGFLALGTALGAAAFFGAAAFLGFGSAAFFGAAGFLVVVAFLVAAAGFLALAAAGFFAGADLVAAGLAAVGFGVFLASLVPPDDPMAYIRLVTSYEVEVQSRGEGSCATGGSQAKCGPKR